MTYNERVQSLAEKMGKVQQHLKYESDLNEVKWEQLTTIQRGLLIIKSKAIARIAVAEMAELLKNHLHPLLADGQEAVNVIPMQPGGPGYGGYDPNNPEPDREAEKL